ncbi:methyltetrahydrofolate cobalamin methyltransferase [Candidatus Aerophobetes bacterium]|uniref:Methyltetrahydrofolate cobalamin methyltransferase n=1 Tax=Aerophobetes bacterium TaxID=2030807 RepID=A0A662D722_UNCAE|nr:MAG: methyltetrahydrofolate cobalamin methyltransferase [Candidatus Aerophobetes bacterium]
MLIIGEKINTSLKGIEEAVKTRNTVFIQNLASKQVESGADMIDVNVGTRIHTEVEDMRWIVKVVQQVVDVPLCIDSPNPEAIEAGLAEHRGKALVNSITAEKERIERILPLIKRFNSKIVALTIDDRGVPEDAERRCEIAEKLVKTLTENEIPLEDIYIDPVVHSISTNSKSGVMVLESIKKIATSFKGIHIICGLSNISFGLPKRGLLNRAFLLMAMAAGLDSVICDPQDKGIISAIKAGEALLGRDEYCAKYLAFFREGKL